MATAYRAPEGYEAPELDLAALRDGSWPEIEQGYIERLAELARQNGTSDLLGQVIRFPRGDGYAQYLVWKTRPLSLIHLELGDAWAVEEALIRGLRLADVKGMVEQQQRLRAIFSSDD